jgi:hypothetical protein
MILNRHVLSIAIQLLGLNMVQGRVALGESAVVGKVTRSVGPGVSAQLQSVAAQRGSSRREDGYSKAWLISRLLVTLPVLGMGPKLRIHPNVGMPRSSEGSWLSQASDILIPYPQTSWLLTQPSQ